MITWRYHYSFHFISALLACVLFLLCDGVLCCGGYMLWLFFVTVSTISFLIHVSEKTSFSQHFSCFFFVCYVRALKLEWGILERIVWNPGAPWIINQYKHSRKAICMLVLSVTYYLILKTFPEPNAWILCHLSEKQQHMLSFFQQRLEKRCPTIIMEIGRSRPWRHRSYLNP